MRIVRDITDDINSVLAEKELDDGQKKSLQDAVKILQALEEYELLENRMAIVGGIYGYYVSSRGSGHSRVLRQGIEKANEKEFSDFKNKLYVVVGTERDRHSFDGFDVVTLDNFKDGHMVGKTTPLAWDNSAIVRLVSLMQIIRGTFRKVRHIVEETTNGDS